VRFAEKAAGIPHREPLSVEQLRREVRHLLADDSHLSAIGLVYRESLDLLGDG
jgi:hypothetical protein